MGLLLFSLFSLLTLPVANARPDPFAPKLRLPYHNSERNGPQHVNLSDSGRTFPHTDKAVSQLSARNASAVSAALHPEKFGQRLIPGML